MFKINLSELVKVTSILGRLSAFIKHPPSIINHKDALDEQSRGIVFGLVSEIEEVAFPIDLDFTAKSIRRLQEAISQNGKISWEELEHDFENIHLRMID